MRFLLLSGSVVVLGVACSREPAEAARPLPVGAGEAAMIEASEAARHELGVFGWGVDGTSTQTGSSVVRGYSEANDPVVAIQTEVTAPDDPRPMFSFRAGYGGEEAVMRVAAEETPMGFTAHFLWNDLSIKPKATRAVEIASADLKAGGEKIGSDVLAQRPDSVADGLDCQVGDDNRVRVEIAAGHLSTALTAKACTGDPVSVDCSEAWYDAWARTQDQVRACLGL